MRLTDLKPTLTGTFDKGTIEMNCPCGHHRFAIPVIRGQENGDPIAWGLSGSSFEDLTLTPSIKNNYRKADCWHGHITNGNVTTAT